MKGTPIFIYLSIYLFIHLFVCLFFVFLAISWAAPMAYGGSPARGPIGAAAASLHHSHSHPRSGTLSATLTTAQGNTGSLTHWAELGAQHSRDATNPTVPQQELQNIFF